MPLTFTAAYSSRITKPRQKKNPSPFGPKSKPKTKAKQAAYLQAADEDEEFEDQLEDHGLIKTLATDLSLRDVMPTMKHIRSTMFDEIPIERSGMSNARLAEVYEFRKSLPLIVTNAHVHALVKSPTSVEKEIAQLVDRGLVRRIVIPGRGVGAASVSDGVVSVEDWSELVKTSDLEEGLRKKYIGFLQARNQALDGVSTSFSEEEAALLMRSGFLTASHSNFTSIDGVFSSNRKNVLNTLTSIDNVSKSSSGSISAIGGSSAVLSSGGGGAGGLAKRASSSDAESLKPVEMRATLPNTGAFLKLIENARSHLIYLLSRSKYREAPMYLLKERWDGNITTKAAYGRKQDPFSAVLPGKTRKWKEFYGLRFEWVLAECLGGGMVEVFETGSVGWGIRIAS